MAREGGVGCGGRRLSEQYMQWDSAFAVVPAALSVLGIAATGVVVVAFLRHFDTPTRGQTDRRTDGRTPNRSFTLCAVGAGDVMMHQLHLRQAPLRHGQTYRRTDGRTPNRCFILCAAGAADVMMHQLRLNPAFRLFSPASRGCQNPINGLFACPRQEPLRYARRQGDRFRIRENKRGRVDDGRVEVSYIKPRQPLPWKRLPRTRPPVVKASGRELSFMLFAGFVICYLQTFVILATWPGEPSLDRLRVT